MKTIEKIRGSNDNRSPLPIAIEAREIDIDARTVELAFSSEEPVGRWFGDEILDHGPKAMRFDRLRNRAAVLVNHDHDDQVGVIESARIDADRVGRAVVRFGRSARASEIFQDVQDGIRSLVSVGYQIHDLNLDSSSDSGDVYRVTDWEPFEISIVPCPADTRVGVGRSGSPAQTAKHHPIEDQRMNDDIKTVEPVAPAAVTVAPAFDAEAERAIVRDDELRRIASLQTLGRQTAMDADAETFIREGKSVDEFVRHLGAHAPVRNAPSPDVGLTEKETESFRLSRLVLAQAFPNNREYVNAAGFELEACAAATAAQQQVGISKTRGTVLPGEVARADMSDMIRAALRANLLKPGHVRTLTAGTATDGAELVATDLMSMNFIDVLRNRLVVMAAGAVMLDNLSGDVAIPRKTSGSAGGWISSEGGNAANSEPQFDQVTLTPKTVAGYADFSRNLLLQSSLAVEAMIRMDQASGIATTIDLAALYGSGSSGQPTGVSATSGINAPTAFAAADPTFAEVIALETAVAVDNADIGALAYITDAAMRGAFKGTEKASGTAQYVWEAGNTVNGYPCLITNQVTDGDVFFGNWSDLLIGAWGGLDVLVDPYTNSLSGTIRVVSHQSIDIAVRHPVSFAYNNDA